MGKTKDQLLRLLHYKFSTIIFFNNYFKIEFCQLIFIKMILSLLCLIDQRLKYKTNPRKIIMNNIFEVHKEPVMLQAIEALGVLGKNEEITLVGNGDSIPDAITVANILTKNLLKGNLKIQKTMVGSEPINQMGSVRSTISIVLRKIKVEQIISGIKI